MKKEKYLRFDVTSLPYYGFLMQVVLPLLLLLIAATRKKGASANEAA